MPESYDRQFDRSTLLRKTIEDYKNDVVQGKNPAARDFLSRVPGADREALRMSLETIDFELGRFSDVDTEEEKQPASEFWQDAEEFLPDRYELIDEIARGGMGSVLRVRDVEFDRLLAVKVMLPNTEGDSDLVHRFERESKITGKLQHPGIPPVVEMGRLATGGPFLSMKLVEGETLQRKLDSRPLDDLQVETMLPIFEDVAQTIAYAHSRKIIHRDIKPSNVMIGAFGEVLVLDWGMAKQLDPIDEPGGVGRRSGDSAAVSKLPVRPFGLSEGAADSKSIGDDLTRAGNVFGTPAYMAPEQARGEVECLDSRTDVFALGAMLCQLLTRKAPNRGDSVREILEKARAGDFEDAYAELDQCRVDSDLVKLTRWCLASDIEDRPADASVVAAAISRHLKLLHEKLELERRQRAEAEVRSREERKRRSLVLLVAGLVLTVVFGTTGTYWWYQKDLADRAMEAGFERRLIRSDVGNLIGQASLLREQGRWKTAAALIDNATRRLGENPPEGSA